MDSNIMPLKIWNGSTSYITATSARVWSGASWVPATSARVWSGASWVEFYPNAIYNANFQSFASSGSGSAFASVSLQTNGKTRITTNENSVFLNWVLPESITQTISHWVRVRNLSGSTGNYDGPAVNTWTQLNSNIQWTLNSTFGDAYSFVLDISLAPNAGNIVATGNVNLITSVG